MMTNLSTFTKNSSTKPNNDLDKNRLTFSLQSRFEELAKKRRLTKPYQVLGIWIAQNLGDTKNIPLFIRLAKTQDRILLESAVSYIKDYPNARSRTHLFLWFLKGKLKKIDSKKVIPSKARKSKKLSYYAKKTKNKVFITAELSAEALTKEAAEIQGKLKATLKTVKGDVSQEKTSANTKHGTRNTLTKELPLIEIDKFFSKNKIETPIQITNPKEYLYEKLSKIKKFQSKLENNFYENIYKFDIFSKDLNIAIDIIDERDQSLAKKSYFEAKKNFTFKNQIKYYIFDACEVTTNSHRILKTLTL